jgi:hypothetical protein
MSKAPGKGCLGVLRIDSIGVVDRVVRLHCGSWRNRRDSRVQDT